MNETYNSVLSLKTIRDFQEKDIAPHDLDAVLEAARWTGSAKNLQDWAFIVVADPLQKDRIAESGTFTTPIRNAPVVICLIQERGGYEFDTGRVAQNIMLAADALGMATCPITLQESDRAAEVLELPIGSRCRYAIAIGYPTPSAAPRKFGGRKPIDEVVHRNTYSG